jgi:hypothetical protein
MPTKGRLIGFRPTKPPVDKEYEQQKQEWLRETFEVEHPKPGHWLDNIEEQKPPGLLDKIPSNLSETDKAALILNRLQQDH